MSEINMLGPAPLFIEPAAESLIRPEQERTSLRQARRGRSPVARRQQESVRRQSENDQQRSMRTSRRNSTALAEPTGVRDRQSANLWQEQIPPGAIFYDEMADITAGVNQPGMLVSMRV